ncbi:ABC transporter transmembrane region family protein, partial [Vibrio parahaemolyticus EKP-028]
FSTAQSQKLRP